MYGFPLNHRAFLPIVNSFFSSSWFSGCIDWIEEVRFGSGLARRVETRSPWFGVLSEELENQDWGRAEIEHGANGITAHW